jgi:hypothetical protein
MPVNAYIVETSGGAVVIEQEGYINTFIEALQAADWSDPETAKQTVVRQMTAYLPSSDLQFLMELSIKPVAAQLGLDGRGCGLVKERVHRDDDPSLRVV